MHMEMIKFHEAIVAWYSVLSDRPPVLWWRITLRGVIFRYMMTFGYHGWYEVMMWLGCQLPILRPSSLVYGLRKGSMLDDCEWVI